MTQNEINLQEWENKENWKWGQFYNSKKDSRIWIPKKPKWMGWTLNFSKKQSYCWLFSLLILLPIILHIIVFKFKI